MAMISLTEAWRRYATPAEKAVASATRRMPTGAARSVVERARLDGYIVTAQNRRRRGRKK